jgi:hypothetical protein
MPRHNRHKYIKKYCATFGTDAFDVRELYEKMVNDNYKFTPSRNTLATLLRGAPWLKFVGDRMVECNRSRDRYTRCMYIYVGEKGAGAQNKY